MSIAAYIRFTIKSLIGRLGRFSLVVVILSVCLMVVFALNVGVSLFQTIEENTLNTPRSFTTVEIHLEDPNAQGSQSISSKSFQEADFSELYQDPRIRLMNAHIYVLANQINIDGREVLDQGILKEIPEKFSNNVHIAEGRKPERNNEAIIGSGWLSFPSVQLKPEDVLGKELKVVVPGFFQEDKKNEYTFRIVGIEDMNDIDSDAIRVPEQQAKEMYNRSRDLDVAKEVSRLSAGNIIVQLYQSGAVKEFSEAWVNKGHFVTTSEDTLSIIRSSYQTYRDYIYAFSGGVLVTIGIIVFLSMNLLVRERYREIGVLKAIGARNKTIANFYIIQGITLALIAAIVSSLVFFCFIFILRQGWLSSLPSELYSAPYAFDKVFIINIILLIVSALGSAYPARRAAKLDPVEAISSV